MRYFIIFFDQKYNSRFTVGNLTAMQEGFPNRKHITNYIAKENNVPADCIVITNVIELTEQDYKDWNE